MSEEAMFDPDGELLTKETITGMWLQHITSALENINRTLIDIEAAILGADTPVVDDLSVPYFVENEPGHSQ